MKDKDELSPIICTAEAKLDYHPGKNLDEMKDILNAFTADLVAALQENGCLLIGHIKGVIRGEDAGSLFFSLTSFEEIPDFKGTLQRHLVTGHLTINVIVYGVAELIAVSILEEMIGRHLN